LYDEKNAAHRGSTLLAFRRLLNGAVFPHKFRKESHINFRNLKTLKHRVQFPFEHVARIPRHISQDLELVSLPSSMTAVVNLYMARQYDEGLKQAHNALDLYPDSPVLHVFLSNFYLQLGRPSEATRESLRAEELWGAPPERLAALRLAAQSGGLKGLWRKRIELNKKIARHELLNSYDVAVDYAALGENDQAIYWLESAYRVRDPKLPFIGTEPIFDGLRLDPRFADLVRRVGLPAAH